jgi:type I restriction enzyme, S subunit
VKKGWEITRLSTVAAVQSGAGFPKRYQDQSGGEIPFYKVSDMNIAGNEREMVFENNSISEETRRELGAFLFPQGSTIFPKIGGAIATNKKRLTVRDCCVDNNVMGVIPKPEKINSEFLFYFFLAHDLSEFANEAHLPSIRKTVVEDWPITLPVSLPEQQRIVGLLDEAFEGIATAKANAEKNLQNARALFESHLQSVFTQSGKDDKKSTLAKPEKHFGQHGADAFPIDHSELARLNAGYITKTGGRVATLRHIPGKLSLAVGMPSEGARSGWRWSALTDLARLESGHTPSRKHPEYWGGSVAWIGIQDARGNHGKRITDTIQKTNELGIANSSARVLPENTVCLSRTASVGYVVVMGRPMATSQDFVNWVCTPKLIPDFLKYLLIAEGRKGLLRYASGSVHQTIYFPEAKAFHVCHPDPNEQKRIVKQCDILAKETQRLSHIYEKKLNAIEALKKSLLHQAFNGEL